MLKTALAQPLRVLLSVGVNLENKGPQYLFPVEEAIQRKTVVAGFRAILFGFPILSFGVPQVLACAPARTHNK